MKKLLYGILAIGATAGMQSCSTSNDVVSNGLFQKRKFNKGYHYAGLAKGQEKATELNKEYTFTPAQEVETTAPVLEASVKTAPTAVLAQKATSTKNVAPSVFASNETTVSLTKKEQRKELKKIVKEVKQMKKASSPASDDFNWGLWCIIGLLGGLLFIFLGFLVLWPLIFLGYLLWVFGVICFWVWLIKMFI